MYITAIVVATDIRHIIITNRKYIPANEQAADVAVFHSETISFVSGVI